MAVFAGIGARDVPEHIIPKIEQVGSILGNIGWALRSGASAGSDEAFERGFDKTSRARLKEIFLPFDGFRDRRDGQNGAVFHITVAHQALAMEFHPLGDLLAGTNMAFMARNGSQVLGRNLDQRADAVVCWTMGGALVGGTAQALRIAQAHRIPICNLGHPTMADKTAGEIVDIVLAAAHGNEAA